MNNLSHLLKRLTDAGIEFVVVGGYAAVLHGSAYITNDLDVCVVLSPENIERLRRSLADIHPIHRMTHQKVSFLEYPPAGESLRNLYLETDDGVLDVLGSVLGIGEYEQLARQSIEISLFGRKCRVISLEGLIIAKEAMGREKDLLTVKELRAIAARRKQP